VDILLERGERRFQLAVILLMLVFYPRDIHERHLPLVQPLTVEEKIRRLMDAAYQKCEQILSTNKEKLLEVAEYLLKNETMDAKTFEACMKEEPYEDQ